MPNDDERSQCGGPTDDGQDLAGIPIPSRAEMSRAVQQATGTSPTSDVSVPRKGVKMTPAQVQAITRLGDGTEAEIRGAEADGTVTVVVGGKTFRIGPEGRTSSPG
jgi:hypothetical protein